MPLLVNLLRGESLEEQFAPAIVGFQTALSNICHEIAALPFQLAYRLLNGPEGHFGSDYLIGVAVNGGACADKMLLLRQILQQLTIESEPVLGGFGATGLISEREIDIALSERAEEEKYSATYHTALIVYEGPSQWLAEPSGGRVGCFLFDPNETQLLLKQRLCLQCPNVNQPLYYHQFSRELTERVIRNKLSNGALIRNMAKRVGIAVGGRWTLAFNLFENHKAMLAARRRPVYKSLIFMEASEIREHPFWKMCTSDFMNWLPQVKRAIAETAPRGAILAFRLEESTQAWGEGSIVVQSRQ